MLNPAIHPPADAVGAWSMQPLLVRTILLSSFLDRNALSRVSGSLNFASPTAIGLEGSEGQGTRGWLASLFDIARDEAPEETWEVLHSGKGAAPHKYIPVEKRRAVR